MGKTWRSKSGRTFGNYMTRSQAKAASQKSSSSGRSSRRSGGGGGGGSAPAPTTKYYFNPKTGKKTYRVGTSMAPPEGAIEISKSDYSSAGVPAGIGRAAPITKFMGPRSQMVRVNRATGERVPVKVGRGGFDQPDPRQSVGVKSVSSPHLGKPRMGPDRGLKTVRTVKLTGAPVPHGPPLRKVPRKISPSLAGLYTEKDYKMPAGAITREGPSVVQTDPGRSLKPYKDPYAGVEARIAKSEEIKDAFMKGMGNVRGVARRVTLGGSKEYSERSWFGQYSETLATGVIGFVPGIIGGTHIVGRNIAGTVEATVVNIKQLGVKQAFKPLKVEHKRALGAAGQAINPLTPQGAASWTMALGMGAFRAYGQVKAGQGGFGPTVAGRSLKIHSRGFEVPSGGAKTVLTQVSPTKTKVTTEPAMVQKWKGMTLEYGVRERPLIGTAGGHLTRGTPKIDLKGVKIDKPRIYEHGFEREIMVKNVKDLYGAKEAAKFQEVTSVAQRTARLPSKYVEKDLPKTTRTLDQRGVSTVVKFFRHKKEEFFGSFGQKHQLKPEYRREVGDIDVFIKAPQAKVEGYASTLAGKLRSQGVQARISAQSKTLIEVKQGGQWRHGVDIHSKDAPMDVLNPGVAQQKAWGMPLHQKGVRMGGVKVSRLSREGVAKTASITTMQKKGFGPEAHRAKDVGDWFRIQRTLAESKTFGKGKLMSDIQKAERFYDPKLLEGAKPDPFFMAGTKAPPSPGVVPPYAGGYGIMTPSTGKGSVYPVRSPSVPSPPPSYPPSGPSRPPSPPSYPPSGPSRPPMYPSTPSGPSRPPSPPPSYIYYPPSGGGSSYVPPSSPGSSYYPPPSTPGSPWLPPPSASFPGLAALGGAKKKGAPLKQKKKYRSDIFSKFFGITISKAPKGVISGLARPMVGPARKPRKAKRRRKK